MYRLHVGACAFCMYERLQCEVSKGTAKMRRAFFCLFCFLMAPHWTVFLISWCKNKSAFLCSIVFAFLASSPTRMTEWMGNKFPCLSFNCSSKKNRIHATRVVKKSVFLSTCKLKDSAEVQLACPPQKQDIFFLYLPTTVICRVNL